MSEPLPKKPRANQIISGGDVPSWFPICGAVFGGISLLFFMILVMLSVFGKEIPSTSKFIVVAVLAISSGLSANFLGGTAAAEGKFKIPYFENSPISFGVTGGIAVLIIVFVLGYVMYAYPTKEASLNNSLIQKPETVEELFLVLEDMDKPQTERLQAFTKLREGLGWRDFRKRNLSNLAFPKSGWRGVEFTEAILKNTAFIGADLKGVNFVRADLTGSDLSNADLREGALNGAILSNGKCLNTVFDDIWLRSGTYRNTDFSGASLKGTNLEIANFTGANFANANLEDASLDGAVLEGAIYNSKTNFSKGFNPKSSLMVKQ